MAVIIGTGGRYDTGAHTLSDTSVPFEMLSLKDAMVKQWQSDQHFTPYQVVQPGSPPIPLAYWPRLNLSILREIRERGFDVQISALILDYDLPNHRSWHDGESTAFVEYIKRFYGQTWDLPAAWTCFYTTSHGARFVYELSQPIPPELVAPKLRSLILQFQQYTGIPIDPKCMEWNRIWRLPQVQRSLTHEVNGIKQTTIVNTWDKAGFYLLWQDKVIDPNTIPNSSVPEEYNIKYRGVIDANMPSPEESRAYLYRTSKTGSREAKTPWFREALRRLAGRECLDVVSGTLTIPKGSRDVTLTRLIGQCCGLLILQPDTTVQHIFALFDEALQQLDPDEQTPDWRVSGWEKTLRFFGAELARVKEQASISPPKDPNNANATLLQGIRTWLEDERAQADDVYALAWASKHAIVASHRLMYVMRPDGRYDSAGVPSHLLAAKIRELEMEDFIPLTEPTARGDMKDVTTANLLARHATIISGVEGAVDVPETTLYNPGTPHAKLVFRLFHRRTDISACYSRDVEDWLRSWCEKEDDFVRLCAWIGHALNFEGGPICALSLQGPPGAGKQMLALGLSECISTETFAAVGDFETAHGDSLLKTPFVVLNEGLPVLHGASTFAEQFRRMIGGDPITINPKHKDMITIHNPVRMLITANSVDAVIGLIGHAELSSDDQQALLARIMHISISPGAGDYLRAKGGLAYTGTWGKRWVRSSAGASSDYILARHFLWLYERRPPVQAGARLLLEGTTSSELTRLLTLRSSTTSVVIEACIRLIEANASRPGVVVDRQSRTVDVTSSAVHGYITDHLASRLPRAISIIAVARCLATISLPNKNTKVNSSRVYRLNLPMLVTEAYEHGYAMGRLLEMAKYVHVGVNN